MFFVAALCTSARPRANFSSKTMEGTAGAEGEARSREQINKDIQKAAAALLKQLEAEERGRTCDGDGGGSSNNSNNKAEQPVPKRKAISKKMPHNRQRRA